MANCLMCSEVILKNEQSIACSGVCGASYHLTCAKMELSTFEIFSAHTNLHYFCDRCNFGKSVSFYSKVDNNSSQLLELKNLINEVKTTVESLVKPSPPLTRGAKRKAVMQSGPSSKKQNIEADSPEGSTNGPVPPLPDLPEAVSETVATTLETETNVSNVIPPILKLIPKPKTIFLSRFDASTTEDDIFKFKNEREIASFKVKTPRNLFDLVVNPKMWPENTVVREFEDRPRGPRNTVDPEKLCITVNNSKN
ncbi:uncharacterized protein LOC129915081 [Episyrphus balteatus]|uniref:uncharacterized protein LOC129915081 n=1 Tax=Episyrphus balteatus TaxID=286459 RepID=UPI0024868F05|nr:uncharacterized protein LOC129915081 [Episyrphus balteatus]